MIPANANRYCGSGLCSWRCRSGYTSTGSACLLSATTTSPPSTTTSPPSSTSPLSWPTPNPSRPCAADSDCNYFMPVDTHNYCDIGSCSWRCNDRYALGYGGRGCTGQNSTPTAAATSPAATPTLLRSYEGATFFDRWNYLNESDPTHGSVIYVSREFAEEKALTYISPVGTAILQIDCDSTLSLGDYCPSVRISSSDTYEPGHLILLDMKHTPHGPSVWRAFWMVSGRPTSSRREADDPLPVHYNDPWADVGEIDVYEGINERTFGQMSLHTTNGCARNPAFAQTGDMNGGNVRKSCSINDGSACSVHGQIPAAYGAGFNTAGSGVFAILYAKPASPFGVGNAPTSRLMSCLVRRAGRAGVATWDGSMCDTRTYFKRQMLTFDITTCVTWAASTSTWNNVASSGPVAGQYATCAQAVQDPAAFDEAYFEINYLRVYTV